MKKYLNSPPVQSPQKSIDHLLSSNDDYTLANNILEYYGDVLLPFETKIIKRYIYVMENDKDANAPYIGFTLQLLDIKIRLKYAFIFERAIENSNKIIDPVLIASGVNNYSLYEYLGDYIFAVNPINSENSLDITQFKRFLEFNILDCRQMLNVSSLHSIVNKFQSIFESCGLSLNSASNIEINLFKFYDLYRKIKLHSFTYTLAFALQAEKIKKIILKNYGGQFHSKPAIELLNQFNEAYQDFVIYSAEYEHILKEEFENYEIENLENQDCCLASAVPN